MPRDFTEHELEAYLDESLATEDMVQIELAIRSDPLLGNRLLAVNVRRNSGVHTVGEIWRRKQISCPLREDLGNYILGTLDDEPADYIRHHVETIGCRICHANLEDLKTKRENESNVSTVRVNKIVQTSAGYLRGEK